MVGPMTSTFGFTPGRPPEWDIERFMRGDEVDTAVITLERNRLTFAWKCADVGAEGLGLRLGASAVTLGGLLKHLAWVEELYFQNRLAGRQSMAPFDQLDLERDWEDWAWSTASDDTPDACGRSGSTPCTAPATRWPRRCPAVGWSRRPKTG
jgi:hypothetical protein